MSVRADLIAARALIDTVNKHRQRQGLLSVLSSACGGDAERVEAANLALGAATPAFNPASRRFAAESRRRLNHPPSFEQEHDDLMRLFDRAIAAAGDTQ